MTQTDSTGKIVKAMALGWLVFSTGFAAFMSIDHGMRVQQGNLCRPGFPGWAYFIPALLFVGSGVITYRKVPSIYPVWQRSLMVLITLALIYATYVLGILTYVMTTAEKCHP